jgi:hypothetical protein
MAVRLDPFRSRRWRRRQRQLRQVNGLLLAAPLADGNNLIPVVNVKLDHGHRYTEHIGLERKLNVLLDHRKKPLGLFGLSIGVHRSFFDETLQSVDGMV